MCRMLMASGRPGDIEGARLRVLLDMFRRASEYDPHLRELTGGREESHDHGWGYYLAWPTPRGMAESLYRSPLPVFEDEEGFLQLEMFLRLALGAPWMILVAHTRKASRGSPVTPLDVHPFHTLGAWGGGLVLAHNGSVHTEELSARVGGRSDSLSLALDLASRESMQEVLDRLGNPRWRSTVARGGLNLAIVASGEEGGEGLVLAAFLHDYALSGDEAKGDALKRYYQVAGTWGERYYILMSSTIAELYGGRELRLVEKGTLATQVMPLTSDEPPGLVEGLPMQEELGDEEDRGEVLR